MMEKTCLREPISCETFMGPPGARAADRRARPGAGCVSDGVAQAGRFARSESVRRRAGENRAKWRQRLPPAKRESSAGGAEQSAGPRTRQNCAAIGRSPGGAAGDSRTSRRLPRDTHAAICGRNDGAGDRRAHGAHGRVRAREFAPRSENASGNVDAGSETMNDDYLWEGRGQPEADVKRLEESLSEFRVAP